jgi:hypothetical protein
MKRSKHKRVTKLNIREVIPYCLLVLSVIVFFRLLVFYNNYYDNKILENVGEVIGDISSYGSNSIHFRFTYEKKKYEVIVDKSDSSFSKVRPVEVDFEKSILSDNFDFSYTVDNKNSIRVQRFPPNIDRNNHKKENWVYYKRENPKIAYLVGFY